MKRNNLKRAVSVSAATLMVAGSMGSAFAATGDIINVANHQTYEISGGDADAIDRLVVDIKNGSDGNFDPAEGTVDNFKQEVAGGLYIDLSDRYQARVTAITGLLQDNGVDIGNAADIKAYITANALAVGQAMADADDLIAEEDVPVDEWVQDTTAPVATVSTEIEEQDGTKYITVDFDEAVIPSTNLLEVYDPDTYPGVNLKVNDGLTTAKIIDLEWNEDNTAVNLIIDETTPIVVGDVLTFNFNEGEVQDISGNAIEGAELEQTVTVTAVPVVEPPVE
jgi:hypothetical protein